MNNKLFSALAFTAALWFSGAAGATVILQSDVGTSFDINVGGNVATTDLSGLSSVFQISVSEFGTVAGTTTVKLDVTGYVGLNADNTDATDSGLFEDYRVSIFGFQVDPIFTTAGVTGVFDTTVVGKDINANGGIDIDVCFNDSQPNNCNGGGGGGISKGDLLDIERNFQITLTFANPSVTSFNLSNFGVRYQSIDSVHYGLNGGSGTGTGNGTNIPEPGSLALLGLGLVGLSFSRWRKI